MIDWLLWIWSNSERVKDIALALSAFFGVIAAPFAYFKIKAYREARRELIAKDLYKSYLQLAIQFPEYAFPAIADVDYKKAVFAGSKEKFESYEWFISYLLTTVSEILHVNAKDVDWKGLMRLQIWYHKRYLDAFGDQKAYLRFYRPSVRRLIDDVRNDSAVPMVRTEEQN